MEFGSTLERESGINYAQFSLQEEYICVCGLVQPSVKRIYSFQFDVKSHFESGVHSW
jgi:hypothetical protein